MIAGYFWFLLVSYCITVWLVYITQGRFPPEPLPIQTQFVRRFVGTVGGLIGGWAFSVSLGVPTPQPAIGVSSAIALSAGVLVGVTLALDSYRLVTARRSQ